MSTLPPIDKRQQYRNSLSSCPIINHFGKRLLKIGCQRIIHLWSGVRCDCGRERSLD